MTEQKMTIPTAAVFSKHIAEIERLQADLAAKHEWCVNSDLEVARLTAENERLAKSALDLSRYAAKGDNEIDLLTAENKQLRAGLEKLRTFHTYAGDIARAALRVGQQ